MQVGSVSQESGPRFTRPQFGLYEVLHTLKILFAESEYPQCLAVKILYNQQFECATVENSASLLHALAGDSQSRDAGWSS